MIRIGLGSPFCDFGGGVYLSCPTTPTLPEHDLCVLLEYSADCGARCMR